MEKPNNTFFRAAAFAISAVMIATVLGGCGKQIEPDPEPTPTDPITTPAEENVTTPPTTIEVTTTEPPPPPPEPLEEYLEYYEQNEDFIGWINIPGITHSNGDPWIDYAVVQADDNSYYLDKNFEGKKSSGGWIYADYKVPITATDHADNITLYGHSMANGTFFRHVLDYRSLSTVEDAYIINFDTRWEKAQYVVVSCFLVGIYDDQDDLPLFEYFKCRNFDTEAEYNYFYENIMLRNYYTTGVECEYGDEFLTLSTCAYEFSDSRFVVVARKVREGEDPTVYEGTYAKNKDKHMPKAAR